MATTKDLDIKLNSLSANDARSIYNENRTKHRDLVNIMGDVVQQMKSLSQTDLYLIKKFGIYVLIGESEQTD